MSMALVLYFSLARIPYVKHAFCRKLDRPEPGGDQDVSKRSERRGKRKVVQPGNREWTTVIQAINAAGWAIPPFIIFAGKNHISSWYEDNAIAGDWVIRVSENGWTTNKLGVAWLKHFDAHTKTRTVGTHRLLIIDGHSSHNSLDFQEIYKETT
ncbi:hypothetical protein GTA08_BOTSDO03422 [Botryosphaeria dothidea]|uniref:DDE-1 domain-containing protein n=1 Tax=Botryosphaeria dothidea TaxID=55169 RepID=A0A8H4N700_9PEZI|nr:hypothetical protein GTA08_BOTSDO03422 [Botryosphaeria dothidea]